MPTAVAPCCSSQPLVALQFQMYLVSRCRAEHTRWPTIHACRPKNRPPVRAVGTLASASCAAALCNSSSNFSKPVSRVRVTRAKAARCSATIAASALAIWAAHCNRAACHILAGLGPLRPFLGVLRIDTVPQSIQTDRINGQLNGFLICVDPNNYMVFPEQGAFFPLELLPDRQGFNS